MGLNLGFWEVKAVIEPTIDQYDPTFSFSFTTVSQKIHWEAGFKRSIATQELPVGILKQWNGTYNFSLWGKKIRLLL